jgi:tight adherence protein B
MEFVAIVGFVVIFAVTLVAVSAGMKFHEGRRKKQVGDILKTVSGPAVAATTKLLKDLEPPEPTGIQGLMRSFDFAKKAREQVQQAGLDWEPSRLPKLTAMAAGAGLVLGMIVPDIIGIGRVLLCVIIAGLLATLPYLHVLRTRRKRLAEMEEQLPDALDFLARSMRAGHAFTISLEMVGAELTDPLGQEFRTLFNEQNLGAPLDIAFHSFNQRVPLLDAHFFSSAVMLQRQTGGNLSEILSRLAYLIRERFRLKGQVKAVSAHGRITAGVLTALPALTALGLMVVSPGYLNGMANDPHGRMMIGGAIMAQILARVCIKRIVNIKV